MYRITLANQYSIEMANMSGINGGTLSIHGETNILMESQKKAGVNGIYLVFHLLYQFK